MKKVFLSLIFILCAITNSFAQSYGNRDNLFYMFQGVFTAVAEHAYVDSMWERVSVTTKSKYITISEVYVTSRALLPDSPNYIERIWLRKPFTLYRGGEAYPGYIISLSYPGKKLEIYYIGKNSNREELFHLTYYDKDYGLTRRITLVKDYGGI